MATNASAADVDEVVDHKVKELEQSVAELLEQQAATREIFNIIGSSRTDVQPAFAAIAKNAVQLCKAMCGGVFSFDGTLAHFMAGYGFSEDALRHLRGEYPILPRGVIRLAIMDRTVVHVVDALNDPRVANLGLARKLGYRSHLVVPMLKDGCAIGTIHVYRAEPTPFSASQISLLQTFANQAVIAIENTRLFEAEQARTKELKESLEYQTATSEVLGIISRSPNGVHPVFEAIITMAERLCHADFGFVYKRGDDGRFHLIAAPRASEPYKRYRAEHPVVLGEESIMGRALLARRAVHVADVQNDPEHPETETQRLGQIRSALAVPLMNAGEVIGIIGVVRSTPSAVSERQIALVETFADQAVIAIENARLFEAEQARTKELRESLEYQTAISDVLGVISRSSTNVQPVFDTVVTSAARLCGAAGSNLVLFDGQVLQLAASCQFNPEVLEQVRALYPRKLDRTQLSGRVVLGQTTVRVVDALADPECSAALAKAGGWRSMLGVPLMRQGRAIGAIVMTKAEAQPYTDSQVQLVQTFADQGVIAIENARLLDELQTQQKELTESLEYQTATSDVLGIISRSPNELQPVLDAIVETAANLCDGFDATVLLRHGDRLRTGAHHGPILLDFDSMTIGRGWITGRAILDRAPVHVHDLAVARDEFPQGYELHLRQGHRTGMAVPLLKEGEAIGAFMIRRMEVRPFSEKQIALLQTFADQAVIAINNARLFEEVQARTRELQESLKYQTATSDVLGVISRSPNELQPVLDSIATTASRLCEAEWACVWRPKDGKISLSAHNDVADDYVRYLIAHPMELDRGSAVGRAMLDRAMVHIPDVLADPGFTQHESQKRGKQRTILAIPLLREGVLVGAISLLRTVVRPFTQRQIDLVTTFADQAVIAISNTRLFEEVQTRTRELSRSVAELKALGETGRAVSSSLDLAKVLPTILKHACEISDTGSGSIYVFDPARSSFVLEAGRNMSEELIAAVRAHPIRLGETLVGQCGERREAVAIEDLTQAPPHPLFELHLRTGVHALLAVPLLHQDDVVGALVVRRQRAGPFAPETVGLLQAFAAQSAIAIHNARLFKEIEEKGSQLELASQHKSQFVANMSHELRTPLAAILGYAELLKEGIYGALNDKSTATLARILANGKHLLGLINTVLDISKIESGQFKLSLGEYALSSMVETVRGATESLAAAKKLALETEVAKGLPHGLGDEQRLTQVLLNLVGNAIKFTDAGEVRISAGASNGRFVLSVSDTGPGIPPEERERIFEKFHQIDNSNTRTKGGTGLGLAIAKDIVELHGGRIWVESIVGRGSTFRLELPVRATDGGSA